MIQVCLIWLLNSLVLLKARGAEGIRDSGDQGVVVEEGSSKAVDSDVHEMEDSYMFPNVSNLPSPLL